jgi:hypothetical protein
MVICVEDVNESGIVPDWPIPDQVTSQDDSACTRYVPCLG